MMSDSPGICGSAAFPPADESMSDLMVNFCPMQRRSFLLDSRWGQRMYVAAATVMTVVLLLLIPE